MEKHPETWRSAVLKCGQGRVEDIRVPAGEQASEYLLMGLRLSEGIDLARYGALAGLPMSAARIADLTALGLIETRAGRLAATARGRPILNAVIAELALA